VFSQELLALLKEVITSWQVIGVTIALVLFYLIFSYTARTDRRPREKKVKVKRIKPKKDDPAAGPVAAESAENTNDELGLEEA
jgi:hypothetical protein